MEFKSNWTDTNEVTQNNQTQSFVEKPLSASLKSSTRRQQHALLLKSRLAGWLGRFGMLRIVVLLDEILSREWWCFLLSSRNALINPVFTLFFSIRIEIINKCQVCHFNWHLHKLEQNQHCVWQMRWCFGFRALYFFSLHTFMILT